MSQEKVFGALVLGGCSILHTPGVHLLHSLPNSVLVQYTKVHQVRLAAQDMQVVPQ